MSLILVYFLDHGNNEWFVDMTNITNVSMRFHFVLDYDYKSKENNVYLRTVGHNRNNIENSIFVKNIFDTIDSPFTINQIGS